MVHSAFRITVPPCSLVALLRNQLWNAQQTQLIFFNPAALQRSSLGLTGRSLVRLLNAVGPNGGPTTEAAAIGSGHLEGRSDAQWTLKIVLQETARLSLSAWAAITSFAARPSLQSHQKSHNVQYNAPLSRSRPNRPSSLAPSTTQVLTTP